jgi:dCMP deaminase
MSKKIRPSWDEYFMNLAEVAAYMGTCDRLYVGCVIVKDKRVIATGFNGSVSGLDHCDEAGHLYNDEGRCIRTVHSEQNALLQCAKNGISTDGAIAYVTHEPCEYCTKSLIQAGIKQVYFLNAYKNKYNSNFNSGIDWFHFQYENKQEIL